jgi:phosphate starvation-inducible PhoH-like protein
MSEPTPAETIDFADPVLANLLFGPRNAHLDMLSSASGARLDSRGTTLFVEDADPDVRRALRDALVQIYELLGAGITLSREDYLRAYDMLVANPGMSLDKVYKDAVFVTTPRKTVTARNVAQKAYLDAMSRNELVFGVGPAGTGKTYLAVAMALHMYGRRRIKRILLTRPAVEAGERLGFLPGDLAEKVNPYLRPLYDALYDMEVPAKIASMLETGAIEIAPLAFMRGRTLDGSFVILDEAQNTTREQMKMFLTRMGMGTRMVVTGDTTQIDLPVQPGGSPPRSGLVHALTLLRHIPGIAVHCFSSEDVMRHPLVCTIVDAYATDEQTASPG